MNDQDTCMAKFVNLNGSIKKLNRNFIAIYMLTLIVLLHFTYSTTLVVILENFLLEFCVGFTYFLGCN